MESLNERVKRVRVWAKENQILFSGLSITLFILLIAFVIFKIVNNNSAKYFEVHFGFWWSLIVATLIPLGVWLNKKDLWHGIKGAMPPVWSLWSILIISVGLCYWASSQVLLEHRVLSDESSWESMGLQMYYHQSGGVCNQGVFENNTLNCMDEVSNFKGKSTGLVYWALFHFFPATRDTALQVNLPLFGMSLILLFMAIYSVYKKPWLALSSAVLLGVMPKMIFQSRAASTEILYVFCLTLLLFLIPVLSSQGKKTKHWWLIIPILGFFSGTRQETLFCFGAFGVYYWSLYSQNKWNLPVFALSVIFASLPIIATIAGFKGYDFQGGNYEPHSFQNLFVNFWDNVRIMLNWHWGDDGLLKYPFSTTLTLITYIASIYFFIHCFYFDKYRKLLLYGSLFFIQTLVIMINVSGNFTIDINQRYVLVMLPVFAIVSALFINDVTEKFNLKPYVNGLIVLSLGLFLVIYHKPSYNANIHYRYNMLLVEEDFLNTKMKELSEKAIYIYSRPWHMLCSGKNAFSEDRFLGWTAEEFAKWNAFSGGHIYMVRGQDGFGTVNMDTRVVGFKTTDKIEQILKKYELEEVYKSARPFGYPLTIVHLKGLKGVNPLFANLSLGMEKAEFNLGEKPKLILKGTENIELQADIYENDQKIMTQKVNSQTGVIEFNQSLALAGMHQVRAVFRINEKDSLESWQTWFIKSTQAQLLKEFNITEKSQGWGEMRIDRTVEGAPLKNNSISYPFGFGSHAPSRIVFDVQGRVKTLNIGMGMDDESMCGDGVIFSIYGDGRELFKSAPIVALEFKKVQLNLEGISHLEFKMDKGETDLCDHGTWYNPWVELK